MTGSFTTMLLSILQLATLYIQNQQLANKLEQMADDSMRLMKDCELSIKDIVANENLNHFVFLGQGPFLGLANEAALKIQEMSISLSQSYHALEYRHGPKSTASGNTLITIMLSENGKTYETHLAEDMKSLGAETLILQAENLSDLSEKSHNLLNVPANYGDVLNPFMYMPLLHLLGYYKALSKNINPDSPKNLSAVVTFETSYDGSHE
jgi:glucosamine--fructose-6-phosphate aminotransferase (isomerizing)